MKVETNIKKKHLIFFSIFIILINSIFVLGSYGEYGHTASEIGPGTIVGPITILTPAGMGDGIKGQTQSSGSSSIYGFVQEGLFAYSGFFEGGDVAIYDKKLLFKNEETMIERSTVSVGIVGTNLVFEDGMTGQKTLSELAASGGSSFWASCTGGICYNDGNVGIGTTTPNQKFVLSDGRLSIQGSSPAPQIELYDSGTDGRDFTIISDEGFFRISDDVVQENRFVINSDGKIGLGIDEPEAFFHIKQGEAGAGHGIGSDAVFVVESDETGSLTSIVKVMGPESGNLFTVHADGQVWIGSGANAHARLVVDGNIKIGRNSDYCSSVSDGEMRYYEEDTTHSKLDICMQTGGATHEWITIKSYSW